MSQVAGQVYIAASPERVWEVLANLSEISRWSPTVAHSRPTAEPWTGVGAGRHLDLAGGPRVDRSIEDRVLEWDEGRRYLLDSSGMRVMKYVRNEWSVAPDGEGSSVTVTFDFAARFGVLGALAERLMMRRAVRKWVRLILAGLKHHIETGEEVGSSLPEGVTAAVSVV